MRWTGLLGAFSCWATIDLGTLVTGGWQGRQDLNLQPSALETDALPLSYSPKELDDLATLRCGYSSAVLKEADVYPFSPNVARVFSSLPNHEIRKRQTGPGGPACP